jgi:hypothetical protein
LQMTDKTTAGPVPDIGTLEIIADWREDLTARLRRAELRYELTGSCREEIIALGDETRDFKRLCQVLKGVIGHA